MNTTTYSQVHSCATARDSHAIPSSCPPPGVDNHGKLFMSRNLSEVSPGSFVLQRYTHSSVPQNNVINKKPLKTPPATNCLITTYRPFYIASLLAYFAEKMYLCSVDISVGNGASRYQLGVLCD